MNKQRRYQKRHEEQGLCIVCANKITSPGSNRCEKHRKLHNKYCQNNKNKRIKEGRCRDCGGIKLEELDDDYKTCINCRQKIRTQKWKEHNVTTN